MTSSILFYKTTDAYGCFSNFARFPIEMEGVLWPTSEHYYQSRKFESSADQQDVLLAKTPFLAAQIGRERHRSFRQDWETTKDAVMKKALEAKIHQHAEFHDILLWTCDATLIEHTANDSYWADGGDGRGRNRLGEMLMELRDELRKSPRAFLPPPWITYPDVEVSDLFWRMGAGEGYLIECGHLLDAMPEVARKEYNAYFPTPAAWAHSW